MGARGSVRGVRGCAHDLPELPQSNNRASLDLVEARTGGPLKVVRSGALGAALWNDAPRVLGGETNAGRPWRRRRVSEARIQRRIYRRAYSRQCARPTLQPSDKGAERRQAGHSWTLRITHPSAHGPGPERFRLLRNDIFFAFGCRTLDMLREGGELSGRFLLTKTGSTKRPRLSVTDILRELERDI